MPVLAKEYTGTFISDFQGENKLYDGCLEIKQSFLNVSIVFKTSESRSFSVLSSIVSENDRKKIVNIPAEWYRHSRTPGTGVLEKWYRHSGYSLNA